MYSLVDSAKLRDKTFVRLYQVKGQWAIDTLRNGDLLASDDYRDNEQQARADFEDYIHRMGGRRE